MDGRRVTLCKVVIRLALPSVVALLGVGLAFAGAWLYAYGPGGGWGSVLRVVTFFMVGAPALVLFFGCTRHLLGMTSAFALFACMILANDAVTWQALADRGRTAVCIIEDAERRTVTEYHRGNEPGEPGYTTQRKYYEYRLSCPQGGQASTVTDSLVGDKGAAIQVSRDPSGRLVPQPVAQLTAGERFQFALLAGGVGLLLSLLDALVDVLRYPRRPDWPRMLYFDALAERWSRPGSRRR